jgi:hypothetical protein
MVGRPNAGRMGQMAHALREFVHRGADRARSARPAATARAAANGVPPWSGPPTLAAPAGPYAGPPDRGLPHGPAAPRARRANVLRMGRLAAGPAAVIPAQGCDLIGR